MTKGLCPELESAHSTLWGPPHRRDLDYFVPAGRPEPVKIAAVTGSRPGRGGGGRVRDEPRMPHIDEYGLGSHGDREVAAGLVDLAVNVRTDRMPEWLAAPLRAALADLARYPDQAEARAAVAGRHGRPPGGGPPTPRG